MENYFKIHKINESDNEPSKSFGTLSHINASFVKSLLNGLDDIINPRIMVSLIREMGEQNRYVVFLASKSSDKERLLSWHELEDAVKKKSDEIDQIGREELDVRILELQDSLKDIQSQFNKLDKTTLMFNLVQKPQIEAQFMEIYRKLAICMDHYNERKFHLYVKDFYLDRIYFYVSADDFVL